MLSSTDPALGREALAAAAQKAGMAELAVPRIVVPVAALPLLGTGRADHVTLKQWAEVA